MCWIQWIETKIRRTETAVLGAQERASRERRQALMSKAVNEKILYYKVEAV